MPLFSQVPPFHFKFRQPAEKIHENPKKLPHILLLISAFIVFPSDNLLSLCYRTNMSSNDAKSIKTTKSAKLSEINISSTFPFLV